MKPLHAPLLITVIMAAVTFYVSPPSAAHLIMGAVFGMALMQTITAFAIWRTVEKTNKERESYE